VNWHNITIPRTQDSVMIPVRLAKIFYIKIKNPEVKTGLVPRLDLGEGLYAGDVIVTNRDKKAYIKIANMQNTDKKIVAPKVELEMLEDIAPCPKNSKRRIKSVRTSEVNAIAIDHIQSIRSDVVRKLLRLDHFNKEDAYHVDMASINIVTCSV